MKKNIFVLLLIVAHGIADAQDNNAGFFYKAFPISSIGGRVSIAGNIHAYQYTDYFGKNIKTEKYTDVHARPETLVYELFLDMKTKDIAGIAKLYDSSYDKSYFDGETMTGFLKNYEDIRFVSKFRWGNQIIIRYDFVATGIDYPFFALVKQLRNRYYLSLDMRVSDPLNLVGTYSPVNLLKKQAADVDTGSLKAFYFINKDNKILFSNQPPPDEFVAVYLGLELVKKDSRGAISAFVQQLHEAARSADTMAFKKMVYPAELPLLADAVYREYYTNLRILLRSKENLTASALLRSNENIVLYIKYSDSAANERFADLVLRETGGRLYLSFSIADKVVKRMLQNVYVQDAVEAYLKQL